MPSGRPSGGKNKCWTKEEKERVLKIMEAQMYKYQYLFS